MIQEIRKETGTSPGKPTCPKASEYDTNYKLDLLHEDVALALSMTPSYSVEYLHIGLTRPSLRQ